MLRFLAGGVDALYLSGSATVLPSLVTALDEHRTRAGEKGGPVPFEGGWSVKSSGFGKYRFCLEHERGLLGVTESRSLPAVRFQPRAEALHGMGVPAVLDWIDGQVGDLVGPVHWTVSRLDLFSDWQGWALQGDDRHRFLCRASARKTYEESGEFTGFEFGTRKAGTLSARIYDKTIDVQRKGTDWWPEVWGAAYDPNTQVHRVEFEINRQAIHEFGLDTPAEVLDGAPSLWRYTTGEWLTYRTPTGDTTKSRWPIAPEWAAIQGAEFEGAAIGLERTLEGKRQGSLRRIMPGLNGYLANFASLTGNTTIDETVAALPGAIRDYELTSRRRFEDRVADKLRERRAG